MFRGVLRKRSFVIMKIMPSVPDGNRAALASVLEPATFAVSKRDEAPVRHRVVRIWLLVVAGLVFLMVVVGGATRLTESGLSIVQWKPITGVVPPLSAAAWQSEFEAYQAIPQYRVVNHGMTLDEFKTIFWWEWAHRLLGRTIGVVFLIPLLWFLWRGWIDARLRPRLWIIFGLGALQGVVGWWMVASGLIERTEVSQYRLATHLSLACLILVAILWTATELEPARQGAIPTRGRATAIALVGLALIQIYLGALLAGLRGGLVYNTWPLIDGTLIPPASELFSEVPGWRNLFENVLTVQFDHRMTAYALWLLAAVHAGDLLWHKAGRLSAGAILVLVAVTVQVGLGVLTLVYGVPLVAALLHQANAIVVLMLAAVHAARLTRRPVPAAGDIMAVPT
jgi:cytochrome c oxidase assembly protein subunit 15